MVSMNEKSVIFFNLVYYIYNIVSNTSNFDMNTIKNATTRVVNKDLLKCRYNISKINVVFVNVNFSIIKA